MACLFSHKWDGCKCIKCGKVRDEQHQWIGCKCSRCERKRDQQHTWEGNSVQENGHWVSKGCKCSRCGCILNHNWSGCKCTRCGAVRLEGHRFVAVQNECYEKCEICGNTEPTHLFIAVTGKCKEKCKKCGETIVKHKSDDCICSGCGERLHYGKHKRGKGCKCALCGEEHDWYGIGSYEAVVASGMQHFECRICGEKKYENAGNMLI